MSEQLVPSNLYERIARSVENSKERTLMVRDSLFRNPETAWGEHQSVELLAAEFQRSGFAVTRNVADLPTAFTASFGSGPIRVGIVLEYDALPKVGQVCGHNIIAAAGLGAALALAEVSAELGITVVAIGTPAEEGGGGKVLMLEAGVFDQLEFAMMIHPGPTDEAWARPLAVAHLRVSFSGASSHASAYPQLGVNASDAMVVSQVALGLLRQQIADGERIHGVVREAGAVPNIIPDSATGSWYIRSSTLTNLDELVKRVSRCFEAGALATGCTVSISEPMPRYSEFNNDVELLQRFANYAAELGRDMDVLEEHPSGMNTASTDMANVSLKVRAIHPFIGIDSLPAVNHQAEFAAATMAPAGTKAVLDGALLMALTTADAALHAAHR